MKADHVETLAGLIDGDTEDGLGAMLEPIRQYLDDLTVTVITMYRGHDAETFTQVVEGTLTEEQRSEWRKAHFCDEFFDGDEDDMNNMFFRAIKVRPNVGTDDLLNADAEAATPG